MEANEGEKERKEKEGVCVEGKEEDKKRVRKAEGKGLKKEKRRVER